jgi:P-type Cu+ transporter
MSGVSILQPFFNYYATIMRPLCNHQATLEAVGTHKRRQKAECRMQNGGPCGRNAGGKAGEGKRNLRALRRACRGERMGYDCDHFAPWPGRAGCRWAMGGRVSRSIHGVSNPVATSSVSTVIDQSLTGTPRHSLKGLGLEAPGQPETGASRVNRAARPEAAACFHCGEPCYDPGLTKEGKAFCCRGCLFVHDLLAESGLGQFYDLNRHPGVRIRQAARREQWAYLDDPALQQRLLDFTDGKLSRVTFQIPAIHCVACVWLLENLFRLHQGIGRSQVNFPRREAAITFAPEKIALSELVGLLASIGYEPVLTLGALEERKGDRGRKRQWLQVGFAGFPFGNIRLLSLPVYLGLDSLSGPLFRVIFGYLSLALAAPVVFYSAADYWRSAGLSLRQRMLTLDVPIVVGLAALYAQSAYEIVLGRGPGYLDSLAGLVFFLLCGRVFQQKTHDRMAFDRDFKCFFPLSVTRKTAVAEESIPISNLQVGDRLLLRNGELIPADARLVNGPACIDYSFVTGEAEPVEKAADDYLYAGGRQMGGVIEVETVKAVSQSHLTSLWNHEAFQKDREGDLNTLTNRFGKWFTLIVIAVAVGAGVFWLVFGDAGRAVKAFISVLIVACPCALALAAPFALGTAQRMLARMQVFLKNGLVLERMARVEAIVFDKTGTLTAGAGEGSAFHAKSEIRRQKAEGSQTRPISQSLLTSAATREGVTSEEWGWVGAVARHSTHPLAVRIGQALAGVATTGPVAGFLETPGCGLEGRVEGHEVRLGSRAWLERCGVVTNEAAEASAGPGGETTPAPNVSETLQAPGSEVCVAIDGRLRGAFVLANTVRPETAELLRGLGTRYNLALLSGDNEKERGRFRSLFGNDADLHFNQSPLDKLGFIRRLQESGQTVMMVGDGLNDAGALKQSDVGVAVVEKVGAFSPASDVIVAASQVPRLGRILDLARHATQIVRLSFGISFLYNAFGIGIAASGILSPVVCAILMPLSSITVVLFACGATRLAARRAGLTK